jgi:hypothetical protein
MPRSTPTFPFLTTKMAWDNGQAHPAESVFQIERRGTIGHF